MPLNKETKPLESQCVSIVWTIFSTQAFIGKPMFSPFLNIILTKICFFVHIRYSSVNFTWFALFTHQKFDDRPLLKPGALHFICHHFE